MKGLIVIPARGGSKGIPRKNIRNLAGKPLIYYPIKTGLKVAENFDIDVYVSSDDEEIIAIAEKFGAKIHRRPKELADDKTTLDEVVLEAYKFLSKENERLYDYIITIQPTSPLLKARTLISAIKEFLDSQYDTIISAKKFAHLMWKKEHGQFVPLYKERINRQFLDPVYLETGGFIICRTENLLKYGTRIGKNINLYLLSEREAIDIDTYEDWNLCEYLLNKKKILFVVSGYREIGLGHVYRTLIIANNITAHDLLFLVDKKSILGLQKIKEYNYPVILQQSENILNDIEKIDPDVVINDILDTSKEYVLSLKNKGYTVINFEDLGEGARYADLVINSLYPEREPLPNHYFGYKYFVPRDEFIYSKFKNVSCEVQNVLITFGGTDPNNLTLKTLKSIYDYCVQQGTKIKVILGLGYKYQDSLSNFEDIEIFENVKNISQYMLDADVIFTSAGRTIYEIACIGTPTIVLAQNERELTHFFANSENGFINMGLGINVSNKEILDVFKRLINNVEERKLMNRLMLSKEVRKGRERVINLIKSIIENNGGKNE
ncbi:glycosyltransferase [Desulfothermus naphthae]